MSTRFSWSPERVEALSCVRSSPPARLSWSSPRRWTGAVPQRTNQDLVQPAWTHQAGSNRQSVDVEKNATGRGLRLCLVRRGQSDPAEGVGEVFGEVFAIGGQEPGVTLPALAERCQEVEPNGVDLPHVNDHLGPAASGAPLQKVPTENPAGPDRSADISRLDEVLLNEGLGVVNDGDRNVRCFPGRQVAGLGEHEHAARRDRDAIVAEWLSESPRRIPPRRPPHPNPLPAAAIFWAQLIFIVRDVGSRRFSRPGHLVRVGDSLPASGPPPVAGACPRPVFRGA